MFIVSLVLSSDNLLTGYEQLTIQSKFINLGFISKRLIHAWRCNTKHYINVISP